MAAHRNQAEDRLDEVDEILDRTREAASGTGAATKAGYFHQLGIDEGRRSMNWTTLTLVFFIAATGVVGALLFTPHSWQWTDMLPCAATVLPLLTASGYCARIANRHRHLSM
ncbi:hypothetical protein ACFUEJ_22340 [Gordonia sp. NPDC057258]|uniref:hypothetical protein n=1 Tax=unclassified Gordonia (in: high G+C Gram-positive bacteria) TaxID=2657482 RepID=UPI00362E9E7B